jgi:hypothetical protein
MKNLSYLLSGLIMLVIIGSISCKKETDPQDDPPSISLQSGTGYISANTTVKVNDSLKFGIRTTPNSSTSAKITTLNFERNFNGQKFSNSYSMTNNNVDLTTKANSQVGTETFTMTITDEKGATASVQVVLTTTAPTFRMAQGSSGPEVLTDDKSVNIRIIR